MSLVEIAKFTTRGEAELAAGALRAYGAPAVAFDDSLGAAAYTFSFSGEGFRVMAPAEWKERAIALLEQIRSEAATEP